MKNCLCSITAFLPTLRGIGRGRAFLSPPCEGGVRGGGPITCDAPKRQCRAFLSPPCEGGVRGGGPITCDTPKRQCRAFLSPPCEGGVRGGGPNASDFESVSEIDRHAAGNSETLRRPRGENRVINGLGLTPPNPPFTRGGKAPATRPFGTGKAPAARPFGTGSAPAVWPLGTRAKRLRAARLLGRRACPIPFSRSNTER
jgi:hypothetical protein